MLHIMFQFDIFGFIGGFFILVFVIAIIFFVIVILIVYKLLHSNVDNVKKKSVKTYTDFQAQTRNSTVGVLKENANGKSNKEEIVSICKYCGENVDENTTFCPYCGSNLAV